MVEQFSRRLVVGWLTVPAGSPPLRVSLHAGPLEVASTWATPGDTMSGSDSVLRSGVPKEAGQELSASSPPLVHTWQIPNVPGPPGDRRNSPQTQEMRTFSLRMRDLWPYVKKSTRITVRVAGKRLPIHGHGMYLQPRRNGRESIEALRRKFDEGYLFSQRGVLQLSKKLDEDWQSRVMALYQQTREILAEEFGYDAFFVYGTLLGAVREGGYIAHDGDFDAAYISRHDEGKAAAQELQDVALSLIGHGMQVECMSCTLHIHDPDDAGARIDLFHTYFDGEGKLSFPFGIAGTSTVTRDDWKGTTEIDFPGGRGLVPVNARQLVEHLYGGDWERPKPGFNWFIDRTALAREGILTIEQRTKVNWSNHYAHTGYAEGSSFSAFVNARPDTPQWVLDIGCGEGRDSVAFGAAGRTVLGLDQSPVGVAHARTQAADRHVAGRVSFEVCDVGNAESLAGSFSRLIASADGPVLYYLRFLLHAISEQEQQTLLDTIHAHARPSDMFAAEFRTDKDEELTKVNRNPYRRFQSAESFGSTLRGYGFSPLHEEEGTGLSPYEGEDPVLYRVVARHGGEPA
jgi:hypothetical protein